MEGGAALVDQGVGVRSTYGDQASLFSQIRLFQSEAEHMMTMIDLLEHATELPRGRQEF
jgi:hypothetical protein